MKNSFISKTLLYCLGTGWSLTVLTSCSVSKQISRQAETILLKDAAISSGHIGISIYEPATGNFWYNHDATHYFIPASNTKLFSLYTGMKYLGDSLVGLRYTRIASKSTETQSWYLIQPTGDPTFLHPDFPNQPVLANLQKDPAATFELNFPKESFNAFGKGWSWDDYSSGYMAERSAFPFYGNEFTFFSAGDSVQSIPTGITLQNQDGSPLSPIDLHDKHFDISRRRFSNEFFLTTGNALPVFKKTEIPFITGDQQSANLLSSIIKNKLITDGPATAEKMTQLIHSQPVDSLFKPMMHQSDNFFAEQTLLMASNERLGYMDDEKMIETVLTTDLTDIPQKPKWVDGSGLSRYNLFTPQSFVYLLNKMKNEFGLQRMENILPTGGEGTLSSYYKTSAGFIFAKTGTLSNNCALSGYLVTKKNKLLVFSILCNNYITAATPVRKAVEQFLQTIRDKY